MNRCFIALDVEKRVKELGNKVILDLKSNGFYAKWVEEENFHITLFFLGEITDEEIEKTASIVKMIDKAPFRVLIDRVGFFQKKGKPTSIWLGIKKNPALEVIYDSLRAALERTYKKPFREKFIPHLTLGRIKRAPADWNGKLKNMTVQTVETGDIVFSLNRSTLTETGPIYETLAKKAI